MVTSANFHSLPPISASVLSLRANAFALSERGGVAVLRADHPNLLIGKWLRTKVTPPRYSNVAVSPGNVTLSHRKLSRLNHAGDASLLPVPMPAGFSHPPLVELGWARVQTWSFVIGHSPFANDE